MKLIFEANDQEKKEIIERHNFFKKTLKTKLKQKLINEQSQPTGGGVNFLKAARDKGCKIAVGGVIKSAPGKPSVLYKVADYDSTNGYFKKGDELYIKDDFTFDVVSVDGSGKKRLSASNKRWACSALTKPFENQVTSDFNKIKKEGNWNTKEELLKKDTEQNIENSTMYEKINYKGIPLYRKKASSGISGALTDDQEKIINKWKSQGAKLRNELDPEQAKTWNSRVVSPASEGYFSQDLIMYFDPSHPTDQKECKNIIEKYYISYTKKRPLEPNEFEKLKHNTQACKNEFYGDWGVLSGGRRIDKLLDIMSGGIGGPSKMGGDAQWRLK